MTDPHPMVECQLQGCKVLFEQRRGRRYCPRHRGMPPAKLITEQRRYERARHRCPKCGAPVNYPVEQCELCELEGLR